MEGCDALKRKLSWLVVGWVCLVLCYMLGSSSPQLWCALIQRITCYFLEDLVLTSTRIYSFVSLLDYLSSHSSMAVVNPNSSRFQVWIWFGSVLAAHIVGKLCHSWIFFFSAVLEWDIEALFKVKKGSGKDNSFIHVFITKHKFYINSPSEGSLTLFPFPMLN